MYTNDSSYDLSDNVNFTHGRFQSFFGRGSPDLDLNSLITDEYLFRFSDITPSLLDVWYDYDVNISV